MHTFIIVMSIVIILACIIGFIMSIKQKNMIALLACMIAINGSLANCFSDEEEWRVVFGIIAIMLVCVQLYLIFHNRRKKS